MGLKIKVDGVEQNTQQPREIEMSKDMTDQLWEVMDENTKLKQENYMLKAKMKEIQRLVHNYDLYE